MVCDIVRAVAACTGTDPSEIGVITPYRAQLARIKAALLPPPSSPQPLLIEVSTIDQYQGRDKACIVVSLVRCNSGGQVGDLLRDWKRINVALTRARAKLILIGCARTLRHALLWNTFLDLADRNGWILRVDDNP
ncbi:AAA domain-containing protein [Blastocladiella britannica]|nr:AAA domain-containing protein [Blastocladiella britannica]